MQSCKSFRDTRLVAVFCCLLVLLTACGPQSPSGTTREQAPEIPEGSTRAPTVTARQGTTTTPAAVQTSCPPAGTARAAVMPSLQVGSHANIIYTFASFSPYQYQGSTSASISPDGQWIVFETYTDVHPFSDGAFITMLELVRIDGHSLQTLFCGSTMISGNGTFPDNSAPATSWSPDQKQLLFNQFESGQKLTLLNLRSGNLQVMVSPNNVALYLSPSRWLDTTRALVATHSGPPGGPGLLVLDTSKGPNQQETSLQTILTAYQLCQNYAISPDATQLYVARCTFTNAGVTTGPSTLSVQSLPGGTPKTIFTSQQFALCDIELISSTSLLLEVCDTYSSQIGLWKINTDGTGLTRLPIGSLGLPVFAPDGNTYIMSNAGSTQLLIGMLNGGAPKTFATTPATDGEVAVVGWTTL